MVCSGLAGVDCRCARALRSEQDGEVKCCRGKKRGRVDCLFVCGDCFAERVVDGEKASTTVSGGGGGGGDESEQKHETCRERARRGTFNIDKGPS